MGSDHIQWRAFDFTAVPGNDPTLLDLAVLTGWNSMPNTDQRHIFKSLSTGVTLVSDTNAVKSDLGGRVFIAQYRPRALCTHRARCAQRYVSGF